MILTQGSCYARYAAFRNRTHVSFTRVLIWSVSNLWGFGPLPPTHSELLWIWSLTDIRAPPPPPPPTHTHCRGLLITPVKTKVMPYEEQMIRAQCRFNREPTYEHVDSVLKQHSIRITDLLFCGWFFRIGSIRPTGWWCVISSILYFLDTFSSGFFVHTLTVYWQLRGTRCNGRLK